MLGNFEALVLTAVKAMDGEGYGTAIALVLDEAGIKASVGPVGTTLRRLETKGLVISHLGESMANRGGRKPRLYNLTSDGECELQELWDIRKRVVKICGR